jgi:hypothetical protein
MSFIIIAIYTIDCKATMLNIDPDDTSKGGLIEKILLEDGKEILDDELLSPIFCDGTSINVGLPAFTRQGRNLSL